MEKLVWEKFPANLTEAGAGGGSRSKRNVL